jgi:hypothetical protein
MPETRHSVRALDCREGRFEWISPKNDDSTNSTFGTG